MKKTNLLTFLSELFFKPRHFFRTYLNSSTDKPPYLYPAIGILGAANIINRIDLQFVKADTNGTLDNLSLLNSWPVYWFIVIGAGALSGYIGYYIGGWFFNLRLKWSKALPIPKNQKIIYSLL